MNVEPKVYLVDDEASVLKAVSRVLKAAGFRTETFDSAQQFLKSHDRDSPGCLVLDMAMPGVGGLELQETLAAERIRMPIVFLTGRADVPTTVRAMKRGAADFLTKPVDDVQLVEAVTRAMEKDLRSRREHAELDDIQERLATLTPREREVLAHVVSGMLNKEVAAALGAAEKTIKIHRARVMEKMGADSLADLVRIAQRAGVGLA
jgi:FixJ family two-component response regulator